VLCALGVVAPEELVRAAGAGQPVAATALIGALAVAAVIVIRLLVSLAGVSYRSRARRERHRTLLDLLDDVDRRRSFAVEGLRVLDGPLPLAYCVPGRSPRVVLSGPALDVLDDAQVAAVLAHEQAHLRHRDEVVMESFTAFHQAVPAPLRSRAPLDAVHLLLEMVADDAARRRCGAEPLRSALAELSDGDGRRLDRLARPAARSAGLTAVVALASAGLLILPTLILVVPWLDRAMDSWPL
jgi:Zn-dependent protease with chaperone function